MWRVANGLDNTAQNNLKYEKAGFLDNLPRQQVCFSGLGISEED